MEVGRGVYAVRRHIAMDDNVCVGLICHLSRSKKRQTAAIRYLVMNYTMDGWADNCITYFPHRVVRKLREALPPISLEEKVKSDAAQPQRICGVVVRSRLVFGPAWLGATLHGLQIS